MSNQEFFNSVRNKIGAGLVEQGIDELLAFIQEQGSQSALADQCRQFRNEHRRLQDERMGSRLTFEAFNTAVSNLEYNLYRACTLLEQELSGRPGQIAGKADMEAPAVETKTGDGLLQSGIQKYSAQDYSGAIADLKAVLEQDSGNAEALFYLGVMREETGFLEEAKALYTRAHQANPQHARAINNRGVLLLQEDDNAGALQDFNRAIKADPNLQVARFNRGLVYMRLGNFAEAGEDFDFSAREGIYLKEVFNLRSLVRINLGQYEEAIKDSERAIQLDPGNYQNYFHWGLALYYQGRYRESARYLSEAAQRQPDQADVLLLRGSAYSMFGEFSKGQADIEALLQLNPEHGQAYFWLGYIRQETGLFPKAVEAYNTCIHFDPYFKAAYVNRGKILMENDLIDEALSDFRTAQQLDPDWEIVPPLIQEAQNKQGGGGMFGAFRKWLNT